MRTPNLLSQDSNVGSLNLLTHDSSVGTLNSLSQDYLKNSSTVPPLLELKC